MRKLLVTLIAAVALSAGAAFAQTGYWGGVSAGYPGASLHFGVSDVSPNLSVRVNAGYNYVGSGFAIGVDALYALPFDAGNALDVYAAGGLGIGIGAGVDVALNILGGAEYNLAEAGLPQGGVFLEVGPSISLSPFSFGVTGRVGFNYHF